MKHTPAPWQIDDGHIFINSDSDREYNSIATVHDIYDKQGNAEVNVHLIATAPELLEALERALSDFKNESWTDKTYDLIESTISKAKGL